LKSETYWLGGAHRWGEFAAFVSDWGWSGSVDRRLFLHESIGVPPELLSAAGARATISQILVVMAPPSVFTLEQRVAHCVRQNAWMGTCNNERLRAASEA